MSWSQVLAVLPVMEIASLLSPNVARAQLPVAPTQAGTLSVFLDCDACDDDFVRIEIAYVNWVRDRTVADVHVLVTEQDAVAGSEQYTLAFIGKRAFDGRSDTLTFMTNPTTTQDEERRGLTKTLALGLVPFVARTSGAMSLRITSPRADRSAPGTQTTPANDPWKAWVFEAELSGDLSGERNYRDREYEMGFDANRTTAAWKTILQTSYRYYSERAIDEEHDSVGTVTSADTIYNLQRSWGTEFTQVKSVTGHLSAGLRMAVGSDAFSNQRFRIEALPQVEYNVFDYSEATRRRLVLQFGAGVDAFSYNDTTIFDKIKETFPMYFTAVNYATQQQWGQSGLELEHRGYLNDPSKRSTRLSGEIDVRLFKGFSVQFEGSYSWIRDQVYLVKEEGDQQDVLLRRRALLTGFDYNLNVGITYTFGSLFNNIVNPRFF